MHTFRTVKRKSLGLMLSAFCLLVSGTAYADLTIDEGNTWDQDGMGFTDLGCSDLVINGQLDLGDGGFTGVVNVMIGPNGSLNGETGSIELYGNWVNDGGSTVPGESTVTWMDDEGCTQPDDILIDGDSNFFNLNLRLPGRTLTFGAGDLTRVEACGFLDMGGDPELLTIISDSDGTAANLEVVRCEVPDLAPPFVSYDIDFVDVKDNYATLPGEWIDLGPAEDFDSVDSGGNTRWFLNSEYDIVRIVVTKDFNDGNENGVMVYMSCNGGSNLQDDFVITEDSPVTFTATDIDLEDGPDCRIWEDVDNGYQATYDPYMGPPEPEETCNPFALGGCYAVNDDDDDEPMGCYFEEVFPGDGEPLTCHITNELQPIDFEITKEWEPEEMLVGLDLSTKIKLSCKKVADLDEGYPEPENKWTWNFVGEDVLNADVYPDWDGDTECEVTEELVLSGVEAEGCEDTYELEVGDDDVECTIVNTVFYEGIPTLSDLGLILMALMMLGVGMFGFRRFI